MRKIIILLLCMVPVCAFTEYPQSPFIDAGTWTDLKPYFLPENHPIKPKLDRMFSQSRIAFSPKTLKDAGFKLIGRKLPNHIEVCRHPKLKGYLLKLRTDNKGIGCEWLEWKKRICGAECVRSVIAKHKTPLLRVPHKWIYPLPINPAPPQGYARQHFILVVEDMHIYKAKDNIHLWRTAMTPELFETLCQVLQEAGMYDSVYIDNIPFSKDGGLVFIDTEHYNKWPIRLDRLHHYLPPKMQKKR